MYLNHSGGYNHFNVDDFFAPASKGFFSRKWRSVIKRNN